MDAFISHKQIGGPNECIRPVVAPIVVALLIGIFISNLQHVYAATPNEPVTISATSSTETEELSQQIKKLVKELEYPDKVAEDFATMVMGWKDAQGEPVLVAWKQKLHQARQDYKRDKSSKDQIAKVEESIARELSQRIQKEISPDFSKKFFDLADVIKHKQAQCLGYSQLVYIVGKSVGVSVKPINVVELMTGLLPPEAGHIASIVSLTDGRTMMVDLGGFISKPFIIEEEFTKAGNYWELKDKTNPLGIDRRIQILDGNGLIAAIYINRGATYNELGQFTQAISDYTKAIELNPKYAEAYSNRGVTYRKLGQHTQAISDYNKAIEFNPKYGEAYSNRGVAYDKLGQYTQAISDYNKAIEFNPKFAEAYYNRGNAYVKLGQPTQAISDCNKAIELNPKYDTAYYNRGYAYHKLSQYIKAISDYTKAIELNPKYNKAYYNRGCAYATLGKPEKAKKDLLKAVELNPALKAPVKRVSEHFKLDLSLD